MGLFDSLYKLVTCGKPEDYDAKADAEGAPASHPRRTPASPHTGLALAQASRAPPTAAAAASAAAATAAAAADEAPVPKEEVPEATIAPAEEAASSEVASSEVVAQIGKDLVENSIKNAVNKVR